MAQKQNKTIGILGGMGPDATAYFYRLIIEKSRSDFGALHNDDYPNILIHSIPVPDFISNQEHLSEALTILEDSTANISNNCSIMCIACNTAHILIDKLQLKTKTPFISMVEETAKFINKSGYKKVGLLATPTTFQTELYQNAININGAKVITPEPEEISELGIIVNDIIEGKFNQSKARIIAIADKLVSQGAQAIVLGCTELPLIFPKKYKIPVISSLEVLANSLLNYYYK